MVQVHLKEGKLKGNNKDDGSGKCRLHSVNMLREKQRKSKMMIFADNRQCW